MKIYGLDVKCTAIAESLGLYGADLKIYSLDVKYNGQNRKRDVMKMADESIRSFGEFLCNKFATIKFELFLALKVKGYFETSQQLGR